MTTNLRDFNNDRERMAVLDLMRLVKELIDDRIEDFQDCLFRDPITAISSSYGTISIALMDGPTYELSISKKE